MTHFFQSPRNSLLYRRLNVFLGRGCIFHSLKRDHCVAFGVHCSFPPKSNSHVLVFALPDGQAMIRNRCENFGDGLCQESRNIKVLEDYLQAHGLKTESHARPQRPERLNLICKCVYEALLNSLRFVCGLGLFCVMLSTIFR